MARFNETKQTNKTTSYEGGDVYSMNLEDEWLNFLMSCMLEETFYESADKQRERYLELTEKMANKHGFEFIAKASKYVRNELGMRSIAQLTAAWLNDKKFEGKRSYFKNFCHRADDVAEIFAAIDSLNMKRSHAAVRGCGDYLSSLGDYQLDKYKMSNRTYNMFDCINITHAHSKGIDAFKRGELKKANTWEQVISASNEADKGEKWMELVSSNSLGYIALIRNLRNIIDSTMTFNNIDIWYMTELIPRIINEDAIKKSLIFPYQIYTAYKMLKSSGYTRYTNISQSLTMALDAAFRISVNNVPEIDGSTAIILDVSGSMDDYVSYRSVTTLKELGAVYAASIWMRNKSVDIIKFGTKAKYADTTIGGNIFDFIKRMVDNDNLGYGTDIRKAFNILDYSVDTIFIISDMQIMGDSYDMYYDNEGIESYQKWENKYGKAEVFSFDISNYHTTVANPKKKNVHCLMSLSPKIFDYIKILQSGVSIVDYINENY